MNILIYPGQSEISAALARPSAGYADIDSSVREVIARVRTGGDAALREFSEKYDGFVPSSFRVNDATIKEAGKSVSWSFGKRFIMPLQTSPHFILPGCREVSR